MNLVSRRDAKTSGVPRYFTGKLCKNKHRAERYTNSGHCVTCVANQRSAWQTSHPEQTRKAWQRYQAANPEKVRAAALKSYYKNPTAGRAWAAANKEKVKVTQKAWRQRNPGKVSAMASKRRSAKLQRTPVWANKERIDAYYNVCAFFNLVNGYTKYHVDHIVPLKGKTVSGLHVPNNLQIILAEDNLRKGNRAWT